MKPYVRISLFCEKTGYTDKAVRNKIANGTWREGCEFHRSPTGEITIDMEAYQEWAEGRPRAALRSEKRASA